jgi:hypothetical protein
MNSDNEIKANKKKRPTWPKLLDLLIRVFHVGTSSVLFGGIVWAVPFTQLSSWHRLTIITGIALIISGICGSRHWPYQGRGLTATVHVGLLGLIHVRPATMLPVLTLVLIAGVAGSHLPGFIRHWSLLHGRRVD